MRYEGKHLARKRRTRAPARRSATIKVLSLLLVALVAVICIVCAGTGVGGAVGTPDKGEEVAGVIGGMEISQSGGAGI